MFMFLALKCLTRVVPYVRTSLIHPSTFQYALALKCSLDSLLCGCGKGKMLEGGLSHERKESESITACHRVKLLLNLCSSAEKPKLKT